MGVWRRMSHDWRTGLLLPAAPALLSCSGLAFVLQPRGPPAALWSSGSPAPAARAVPNETGTVRQPLCQHTPTHAACFGHCCTRAATADSQTLGSLHALCNQSVMLSWAGLELLLQCVLVLRAYLQLVNGRQLVFHLAFTERQRPLQLQQQAGETCWPARSTDHKQDFCEP